MTRENCAYYPQVTRGVNKMCSQFVWCWIRSEKRKLRGLCFGLSTSVYSFILVACLPCVIVIFAVIVVNGVCLFFFFFQFFSSFELHLNTYVLVWMVISTWLQVTPNPNTRHSIKKKPIQSSKLNQGQRESVSTGTGITDLGGIGKTNSKQVYYIWRAIFTASIKRTQKVLYLSI